MKFLSINNHDQVVFKVLSLLVGINILVLIEDRVNTYVFAGQSDDLEQRIDIDGSDHYNFIKSDFTDNRLDYDQHIGSNSSNSLEISVASALLAGVSVHRWGYSANGVLLALFGVLGIWNIYNLLSVDHQTNLKKWLVYLDVKPKKDDFWQKNNDPVLVPYIDDSDQIDYHLPQHNKNRDYRVLSEFKSKADLIDLRLLDGFSDDDFSQQTTSQKLIDEKFVANISQLYFSLNHHLNQVKYLVSSQNLSKDYSKNIQVMLDTVALIYKNSFNLINDIFTDNIDLHSELSYFTSLAIKTHRWIVKDLIALLSRFSQIDLDRTQIYGDKHDIIDFHLYHIGLSPEMIRFLSHDKATNIFNHIIHRIIDLDHQTHQDLSGLFQLKEFLPSGKSLDASLNRLLLHKDIDHIYGESASIVDQSLIIATDAIKTMENLQKKIDNISTLFVINHPSLLQGLYNQFLVDLIEGQDIYSKMLKAYYDNSRYIKNLIVERVLSYNYIGEQGEDFHRQFVYPQFNELNAKIHIDLAFYRYIANLMSN